MSPGVAGEVSMGRDKLLHVIDSTLHGAPNIVDCKKKKFIWLISRMSMTDIFINSVGTPSLTA